MEAGRIVQYGEPEEIVLNPANAYVAEFIAHMDALNVLRCRSLMTPVANVRRDGDMLRLDWSGLNRLRLNAEGEPDEASIEPAPATIRHYSPDLDTETLTGGTICAAAPDLPMRTAIELRHCTGRPVLLMEQGRMVGVIGDDEIYRGLMRQGALAGNQQD